MNKIIGEGIKSGYQFDPFSFHPLNNSWEDLHKIRFGQSVFKHDLKIKAN